MILIKILGKFFEVLYDLDDNECINEAFSFNIYYNFFITQYKYINK